MSLSTLEVHCTRIFLRARCMRFAPKSETESEEMPENDERLCLTSFSLSFKPELESLTQFVPSSHSYASLHHLILTRFLLMLFVKHFSAMMKSTKRDSWMWKLMDVKTISRVSARSVLIVAVDIARTKAAESMAITRYVKGEL